MDKKALKISLLVFLIFSVSYFFFGSPVGDTRIRHYLEGFIPVPIVRVFLTPVNFFFLLVSILPVFTTLIFQMIFCKTPANSDMLLSDCGIFNPLVDFSYFLPGIILSYITYKVISGKEK